MTQRYFENDKEFHQAALAYAAFAVYESACDVISDGNVADISEATLFHLITVAKEQKFDMGTKNAIGMYANLVQEENAEMMRHR